MWQAIANGLVLGSVYALLALGYSMVYGVLGILNFAHGDVFMVCSFVGWYAITLGQKGGFSGSPLVMVLLSILISMAFGAGLGMAVDRVAYRPLRKASRLAPLISAIGVSMFLQNVVMLATQGRAKVYPTQDLMPKVAFRRGPVTVSYSGALVIASSLCLLLMLNYVVRRTSVGRMMRATAEDPEAAGYMGIPVNRVIAASFGLGSGLAGAAGVLIGLYYMQVDFYMGFSAGMKAFTAAVLGGVGNLGGAVLGGLLLGLAESLGTGLIAPVYKDAIAFAVLIVCLIVRPRGILGESLPEKV